MRSIIFFVLLFSVTIVYAQLLPPDTAWTYSYQNGPSNMAYSIAQTPDGGFVVGGESDSGIVIKLDEN